MLNGKRGFAKPDSGSEADIISQDFAQEHKNEIERTNRQAFKLGNGKEIQSVGTAFIPCELVRDDGTLGRRLFHVLAKCVVPVLLGLTILEKSKLYISKQHLLVDSPFKFKSVLSLKYLGSPLSQN
jgi:hypothetical protein